MPNQRASSSKEHQDLIVVSPSLDLTEAFPTILKSVPPRLRDPHLGDRDQLSAGPAASARRFRRITGGCLRCLPLSQPVHLAFDRSSARGHNPDVVDLDRFTARHDSLPPIPCQPLPHRTASTARVNPWASKVASLVPLMPASARISSARRCSGLRRGTVITWPPDRV